MLSDPQFRCEDLPGQVLARELSLDAFMLLEAVRDAKGEIVDFQWRYANPVAARLLGMPSKELFGRCLLEVRPDDRGFGGMFDRYVRVVETGEAHDVDVSVREGGSLRWYRNMAVRTRTGVAVTFADITERKVAEEKLRISEERYRMLSQVLSSIVWTTDANGHFCEPQPAWEAFTGQPWEVHRGSGWLQAIRPDEQQRATANWRKALATKSVLQDSGHVWHAKSSTFRFCTVRAVPLLGPDGTIREWIGNVTDHHDEKMAQAVLREQEQALREAADYQTNLIDSIPHMVWVTDGDGVKLAANRQYASYTGIAPKELLGLGWMRALHPDDGPRCTAAWRKAGAENAPYECELRFRRWDGEYRWHVAKAMAYRDESGKVTWFGTNTDIHENYVHQEQLKAKNAELTQFAYVASHDLKEPLRVVRSHLQMVRRYAGATLPAKASEHMDVVMEASKRMYQLIDDLLEFARVGVSMESAVDVDTKAVVDDVLQSLDEAITEAGATIDVQPLPRVRAVNTQVRQLFQNLVGNALKFRGTEKPHVVVSVVEESPREVTFSVRDNGIGIPPSYHERIFEVFQRLHDRGSYSGTGIGLAICKKIVEMHGGRIGVRSAPGEGADFFFTLPRE